MAASERFKAAKWLGSRVGAKWGALRPLQELVKSAVVDLTVTEASVIIKPSRRFEDTHHALTNEEAE